MTLFTATINQMAFLFALIALGYILAKLKVIPQNSETVLSRLENYLFIPCLVLGTFINNFTVQKLSSAGKLLLGSIAIEAVVIPVSILLVKLCAKDKYTRNIFLYGLAFSNFGFMGNAVVQALFPDIFLEYMIFVIVLWTCIYVWGAPILLMGDDTSGRGLKSTLKRFVNPMFICMVIGMIIGISGLGDDLPSFVTSVIDTAGSCMSPVAMLLTGMTLAKIKISDVLKIKSIYAVTALRLLVFPLVFIAFVVLVPFELSETFIICGLCSLAMPLGLNTIVIPSAYGKDTTVASGMALISHTLSCITIPIIFMILTKIL
ncbi:MAG: hypothetical protein E7641_07030 [Ruminococcaceae bacterium]|nr:hypothetical protein [Oscillospiraceae bacterium]